jgi:hypothetical protein
MEINAEKTRVMAFRGMEPIRSKICINKTLNNKIFLIIWDTTFPSEPTLCDHFDLVPS